LRKNEKKAGGVTCAGGTTKSDPVRGVMPGSGPSFSGRNGKGQTGIDCTSLTRKGHPPKDLHKRPHGVETPPLSTKKRGRKSRKRASRISTASIFVFGGNGGAQRNKKTTKAPKRSVLWTNDALRLGGIGRGKRVAPSRDLLPKTTAGKRQWSRGGKRKKKKEWGPRESHKTTFFREGGARGPKGVLEQRTGGEGGRRGGGGGRGGYSG